MFAFRVRVRVRVGVLGCALPVVFVCASACACVSLDVLMVEVYSKVDFHDSACEIVVSCAFLKIQVRRVRI